MFIFQQFYGFKIPTSVSFPKKWLSYFIYVQFSAPRYYRYNYVRIFVVLNTEASLNTDLQK